MGVRELLGRFVVFDAKPVKAREAQPPEPAAVASAEPAPGSLSLSEIYERANLPAVPMTAEQALEIIVSLPKKIRPETQGIVLREALTVKPEVVAEDARRKIGALGGFITDITAQVAEFVSGSEAEISEMESQITDRRRAIEQAQAQQRQHVQRCQAEIDRLSVVSQLLHD